VLGGSNRFKDAARPRLAVMSAGEPWTFGFRPEELPHYLKEPGLQLVEDLDANQYRRVAMGAPGVGARGYKSTTLHRRESEGTSHASFSAAVTLSVLAAT
jgi:O-methyltransferase involved in polyketide biosynthesis